MGGKRKPDPWQRIMLADHRGRGLRLSMEEVQQLAGDDAIESAAANALCEKCLGSTPTRYGCTHGNEDGGHYR